MKLHRKAKTTPVSRFLLVSRVLDEHWSYAEVAEAFSVSMRTVAKWVKRFREGGVAALMDGSSRPGPPAHQTPPLAVYLIGWLRREHGLPAWAIAMALRMPRSTVSRWLQRLALNRPAAPPPTPVQRYEWPTAGDLLHLDIKTLAQIVQEGHRIHGDPRRRSRGAGWEYVHVAVDDHSRIAYVEVLTDQTGATCAAFLDRAMTWFAARGITIRRVLTDNGPGYLSRAFRATTARLAVTHKRTRPYRPRTNGKAERFIQTLLREWAYVVSYPTSQARRDQLPRYLAFYNQDRPHASLNYEVPWSRKQSAA